MYILDPEKGEQRRALVREQAETYRRWTDDLIGQGRRSLGQQTCDLYQQTRGLRQQARSLAQQTRDMGQQARGLGQWAYELLGQARVPHGIERSTDYRWLGRPEQMQATSGLLLLGCVGLGIGLMYMFDPQGGRRRRALVRDKAVSYWQRTGDYIGKKARDARNRTRGFVSEARTQFQESEAPDDTVLEARVRAQLGHVASNVSAIQVTARRGCVTLRGPVQQHEVDTLLSTTAAVSGVSEVVNQLDVQAPSARSAGMH